MPLEKVEYKMCQYHDYILQQMIRDRVEDAHRQADIERWIIREARRSPAGKQQSRPVLLALIQSLVRHLFGWRAKAHGRSW